MNEYLLRSKKTVTDLSKIHVTPVKSTIPPEFSNILPTNHSPLSEAKSTVKNDASGGTTPDKGTSLIDRISRLMESLMQPLAQPQSNSTPDPSTYAAATPVTRRPGKAAVTVACAKLRTVASTANAAKPITAPSATGVPT